MSLVSGGLINNPQASYPGFPLLLKGNYYKEYWNRTALAPTGGYTLYTSTITGTGTNTIDTNDSLGITMTTSANAGDDNSVRATGFFTNFREANRMRDIGINSQISKIEYNMMFATSSATDTEFFVGLYRVAALTDLPTTVGNAGVYVNQSASNNLFITIADDTSQTVNFDTSEALAANEYFRVQIVQTAAGSCSVSLYGGGAVANINTQIGATQTGNYTNRHVAPYYFINTEAAAAKTIVALPWSVNIT